MANRGESLAKTFEAKAAEAIALIESLSDADWKKVTVAEQWPVGVTARHIGWGHEVIAGIVQTVAGGAAMAPLTMDALNALNAKNAAEWAGSSKSDVLALHRKNAAAAAAIVRGIPDAGFDRKAEIFSGMPPMSAGDLAGGILVGHVDEHLGSIRATTGR